MFLLVSAISIHLSSPSQPSSITGGILSPFIFIRLNCMNLLTLKKCIPLLIQKCNFEVKSMDSEFHFLGTIDLLHVLGQVT